MSKNITKEDERKALAKIKAIVDGLGEDSYVATAFEGCFEIAEENIANDWACSYKQKAESEEKYAKKLELDNRDLRLSIKKIKEEHSTETTALKEQIKRFEASFIGAIDLQGLFQLTSEARVEATQQMNDAAELIVQFAEKPDSTDFKRMVRKHREFQEKVNHLAMLEARIADAEKALHNQ